MVECEKEIVKEYCRINELDYLKIYGRLKNISKYEKYNCLSIYEKLDLAKEKYLRYYRNKTIKDAFCLLEIAVSNKDYRSVCEMLKIRWNRVCELSYRGYEKIQVIKYIWFFGDLKLDGYRDISNKRWRDVKKNKLFEDNLYYVIAYYRCGEEYFLDRVFEHSDNILKKLAYSVLYSFHLTLSDWKDLYFQARLYFLELLQKIALNSMPQIVAYIYRTIYGQLVSYAKENYVYLIEFDENYMTRNSDYCIDRYCI